MTAIPTHSLNDPGAWRSVARRAVAEPLPKGLDALWLGASGVIKRARSRQGGYLREAAIVKLRIDEFAGMDSETLRTAADDLRANFRLHRESAEDIRRGIALASVAAQRTLGLTPHAEQIAAAIALDAGACVEMATGEGKTLVGALASTLAGWRGEGCHVITTNDYLARRDAESLAPMHRLLGLRTASIQGESGSEDRRAAYACDITFCTSKEAAADALRDRIIARPWRTLADALIERALGHTDQPIGSQLITRGQACAIVDEADAVLIDEAVTPLILSAPAHNEDQEIALGQAAQIAKSLSEREDYIVDRRFNDLRFTPRGLVRIDRAAEKLPGVGAGSRRQRELIDQALRVREFFREGEQYVIDDGKVVIVDESTGRLMPDRTWRQGLHQAIEASEGLEPTPVKDTLARISFQRYFRGYRRLSGMTGTAREVKNELWSVYGLPVVTIPSHKPCLRVDRPPSMSATTDERFESIIEATSVRRQTGQPVLIGTRTVEASERVGNLLKASGIEHQILNAVRGELEAEIIARAGQRDAVTVATNMAGRGTDIALGEGVDDLGGLCVIVAEPHQSARLDRQLMGRAGRQGDPGESLRFQSLEDDLFKRQAPGAFRRMGGALASFAPAGRLLTRFAQRRAMHHARAQRMGVTRQDEWLEDSLGFAGPE